MATYTMKDIDEMFFRKIKSMAVMRGMTLKALILRLLRDELEMWERERREL